MFEASQALSSPEPIVRKSLTSKIASKFRKLSPKRKFSKAIITTNSSSSGRKAINNLPNKQTQTSRSQRLSNPSYLQGGRYDGSDEFFTIPEDLPTSESGHLKVVTDRSGSLSPVTFHTSTTREMVEPKKRLLMQSNTKLLLPLETDFDPGAEEASFADEQEEQEEEVSASLENNNNRDGKKAKVTRYDMAGNIIKV